MIPNKRIAFAGIIVIMMMLLIPAVSFSDVVFTSLNPISNGLRLPEDVAVSPDGKVYVVDGSKNKILIYDEKCQFTGNISIHKPTTVAVNNNGYIYIGTNNDLSVKIFDAALKIIGSLGIGSGEFKLPRNITIDTATGNIYVVDQLDHSIKIYTSNGTYLSKINDYPNLPQDVTIVNNEIYVIDHPLIKDGFGGTIRGAEVQVFDVAGNPIRHFGTYGSHEGQFIRPAGITSDEGGLLYISDSYRGVAICFDENGGYLGEIQNLSKPMVTPMGIALGKDRRLFIASLNTSSVEIFGLEENTNMDVSPSVLLFTAQESQPNPSDQALTISNSGTGTLTYTASSSQGWIVLSNPSETVGPNSSGTITVGVNISGLIAGTYNSEITITGSSGVTQVITVKLEIAPKPEPPVLTVKPQTLNYSYSIGGAVPPSQTVTIEISNSSDGITTWAAVSDAWISITPSTMSGNSFTTVASVTINPANLAAGNYTGSITISAPGAGGSPAKIGVNLTVKYAGTINVNCNIPGASFAIAGPGNINYTGSGEHWTAIEIPDGTYTITFNPAIGYKTPSPETKTISGSGTISFEGNYISLAQSANIVVSRASDYRNPPATGIFDASGKMLSSFVPFSRSKYKVYKFRYKYGVNTAIGDIDGDGKADIVAALGPVSGNPAAVEAYRADGSLIPGSDFIAMNTTYGANIAVADFDGDGKAEIVVGAGASSGNPARVRVFSYASGKIVDTGIDFNAFTVKGGVNIATGDVDGDGIPEIITAAGANKSAGPEVKVWKVDTSKRKPYWSIIDTGIHFVAFSGIYGANVATGDLDGDGISEIIVASGPDPHGGYNMIKAFTGEGKEIGPAITDSSKGYGLDVASADLDNDGIAEIITGLGPSPKSPCTVKIYRVDGTLVDVFNAFNGARYGAVISAGDLGY